MSDLVYKEEAYRIIGICMDVHNYLDQNIELNKFVNIRAISGWKCLPRISRMNTNE